MKRKDNSIFAILLLVAALTGLNSCGPGGARPNPAISAAPTSTPEVTPSEFIDQTGGITDNGRNYVTLSPQAEVQQVQQTVPVTEPNQTFAKQFSKVKIISNPDGGVDFKVVRPGNFPTDLLFKGTLIQYQNKFVGKYVESTDQRPDLTLDVSCDNQNCFNAHLLMSDQKNHKAAIIASRDKTLLHATVPEDEDEEELTKDGLMPYGQDARVIVNTTQIFPGKTTVTVEDEASGKVLFDSELHETQDDEEVPAQADQTKEGSVKVTVEAKDENGPIYRVSRIPDPKKPDQTKVVYYGIRKPNSPPVPVDVPQQCPVRVSGSVHPLVAKILKEDCGDTRLAPYMKVWKNEKRADLALLLNLHNQVQTQNSTRDKINDFKIVVKGLHDNDLPMIMTVQPLWESTFDKTKVNIPTEKNPHGRFEVGLWQFLPETATNIFHITLAEAKDPRISTQKASDYLNKYRKQFNDDMKLTLAAYNGTVYIQNKLTESHQYTPDFWKICQTTLNRDLSNGSCKYVTKILSGMITSLDPEGFGMANMGAPLEGN